jgi:hypothetical protein
MAHLIHKVSPALENEEIQFRRYEYFEAFLTQVTGATNRAILINCGIPFTLRGFNTLY